MTEWLSSYEMTTIFGHSPTISWWEHECLTHSSPLRRRVFGLSRIYSNHHLALKYIPETTPDTIWWKLDGSTHSSPPQKSFWPGQRWLAHHGDCGCLVHHKGDQSAHVWGVDLVLNLSGCERLRGIPWCNGDGPNSPGKFLLKSVVSFPIYPKSNYISCNFRWRKML